MARHNQTVPILIEGHDLGIERVYSGFNQGWLVFVKPLGNKLIACKPTATEADQAAYDWLTRYH